MDYGPDSESAFSAGDKWFSFLITQGVMGRTATFCASQLLLYLKYRLHFASSKVVFSPLHEFSNDPF